MPSQELDPEVYAAIQKKYNPSSGFDFSPVTDFVKEQGKGIWNALTGPKRELLPGEVPYSSKFGSADEWQEYNRQAIEKNKPIQSVNDGFNGAQAGVDIGGMLGDPSMGAEPADQDVPAPTPARAQAPFEAKPIMGKLAGDIPPTVSDQVKRAIKDRNGYNSDMDADALKRAQAEAASKTQGANMGEAMNDIIWSIARHPEKADNKFYNGLRQQAQQPVENLQQLRAAKLGDVTAARTMAENDPNSDVSINLRKAYEPMLRKLGLTDEAIEGATANDMKGFFQQPVETALRLKQAAENKEMQMALIKSNKELAMGEKHRVEAKLTDKQADDVSDFDKSIAAAEDAIGSAKKDYTGPLTGRVPDMLVGGEEAAFRSKIGQITDSYRKLITGAGASNQELRRLESRLPGPNDNWENFQAKAKSYVQALKRNRAGYLDSLSRRGKDTTNFQEPIAYTGPGGGEQDAQALAWAEANPGDKRAQKILELNSKTMTQR